MVDSGQSISLQSLGSLLPKLNNPTSAGHLRPAKADYSLSKDSCCWWLLCSTSTVQADLQLLSHVILNESLKLFMVHLEYPLKWCTFSAVWLLHGWCHVKLLLLIVTWLVPCETAAISAGSVYSIQPCTMLHHFTQSQKESRRIKNICTL